MKPYNSIRAAEDLGNFTALEHLNVEIPNQGLASDFYLLGMGFTRDPYLFPGTNNMWVNIGKSQIHMPSGDALVFRGHIGIVAPDRKELLNRLQGVKKNLADTKFSFKETNDYVLATCPWGNEFHVYEPDVERFGNINLGLPFVEFTVPEKTAKKIAKFYRKVMGANTCMEKNGHGKAAHIKCGLNQELIFRETDAPLPEFDGHHLQVYVEDFPARPATRRLKKSSTQPSPRRATAASIASRTSSTSTPAMCCSRSSTKSAA